MLETQRAFLGRRLRTPVTPGDSDHLSRLRNEIELKRKCRSSPT
jgi:hypothetical protein